MPIERDAWLSERLGHAVYSVAPGTSDAEISAHEAGGRALYQAKVPAADVAAVRALARFGFYAVDVNVTLAREPDADARPAAHVIVRGDDAHRDAVLAIAESSFRYSRFHLDPAIPRQAADRVKRDWVASYFAGTRGDHLLVALEDERPIGFLAVLTHEAGGRRIGVIDLVGVARRAQRRGVGRALTAAFLAEAAAGCDRAEVGTQAANVIATGFYERLGFAVDRTAFVLHRHVGEAA